MSESHLWIRACVALLLGSLGTGCSLFGGVHVENVATGAQRPANVALYVAVSDGSEPVTDLEPYLGAHGHLVVLREGDLAYLHVDRKSVV